MRQQLEKHRANPTCASCHRNMDPLGFGLENYDAIGKWRDHGRQFPVDSTGTLPNGKTLLARPDEMRALLVSQLPQFSRTLTREDADLRAAAGASAVRSPHSRVDPSRSLAADGYRFQTLIHQIVASLPFQATARRRRTEGTLMFITRKALPRRTFLRGIGTAVALPFLDAMMPALARAQRRKPPVRMAFVYVPNGIDMRHWNPAYEGDARRAAATS